MRRCEVGSIVSVSVFGDWVHLGGRGGILIIGVGELTAPQRLGELPTLDIVYGFTRIENRLYLANGKDGMVILEVADPSSPRILGKLDTPGFTYDLAVDGRYAYLADGDSGLVVVDVEKPGEPRWVSRLLIPGRIFAIELFQGRGYLAGLGGVWVVDLSNPHDPKPAGYYPAGWVYDLAVAEPYIYLACDHLGLQTLKCSQGMIELVSQLPLPGYLYGIELKGDRLYLACNGAGLWVVDVSDPADPKIIGGCNVPGWARRVSVQGNYAYLASGLSGLRVVDLRTLKEVSSYEVP